MLGRYMLLRTEGGARARIMAALSYLGVLVFVPLILNRDDEYVYFHAKQGVVIWMWGILGLFGLHLPGIGKWWFSFSTMMVAAFSVVGLLSVVFNRAWKLPLIHWFAARL
ncbi:MAG: hypothetical protein ABT940_10775 [Alphaproteobacteria bacterium]